MMMATASSEAVSVSIRKSGIGGNLEWLWEKRVL